MITLFSRFEAQLRQNVPQEIAVAERLAADVVDSATGNADQCWRVIWNKPLYANTRIATGERQEAALVCLMDGAWQMIGTPGSDFQVTRVRPGWDHEAFMITGARAEAIRTNHHIAAYRMLAIQGGANALRRRVIDNAQTPYANLAALPMRDLIVTVREEMGSYWGHITVLHFLTAFGLACKPDRHLVRTMQALRMPVDVPVNRVPNLNQSIAINQAVHDLATRLYGTPSPRRIRYLDKVLMEMSRQGIIETSSCNDLVRERQRWAI